MAQLMYYTKDIESFGTGLKRITEACKKAGVRVEFEMLKLGFAVVFYRPNANFLATEKTSDVVRSVARDDVRNKTEQTVLSAIAENPSITAEKIAEIISKSPRTVQRYLDSLQKKNLVRRVGSTKSGLWEIIGGVEQENK
ncbi:hypothetical protein FACS1894111_04370 [Clostridia bacterium]|nr:hypothetical protein FACS1894111_04370 [Clostridia bacterium]